MADDVRAGDFQLPHQGDTVCRLVADADSRIGMRTAAKASTPIANQLIAVQRRLRQHRHICIGENTAVNQHDWLAGALGLVFEPNAIDICRVHRAPPLTLRPKATPPMVYKWRS